MNMTNTSHFDLLLQTQTMSGDLLRLETLDWHHLSDLANHLLYPNAWHSAHWNLSTIQDLERSLERSKELIRQNRGHGFAMILNSTNQAVGISYFMEANKRHRFIEIGGTWIGEKWQKTSVNTQAKLLMLTFAFESMKCQRVEFRVDSLNFNSQRAVLRIGAKYEGELRNSCLLPDGRKRDYKVYSIIDSEWPNVKTTLIWYKEKYVST